MKYTIDVNNEFYLEVEKKHNASSGSWEPYVAIIISIVHKKYSYLQFNPIIMVECVYERWLFSKLYGQSWSTRVKRNEKKLIKKAKQYINKLPRLEECIV